MFLYDNRTRTDVLASDFLPELEAGNVGTVAAGIYIEDQYLPDKALEVALAQIARIYVEIEHCNRFAICRSYQEIKRAREQGKIALVIAMEGAEPLGTDLNLLRIFYELGLRLLSLTHARSNAAGSGGVCVAVVTSVSFQALAFVAFIGVAEPSCGRRPFLPFVCTRPRPKAST